MTNEEKEINKEEFFRCNCGSHAVLFDFHKWFPEARFELWISFWELGNDIDNRLQWKRRFARAWEILYHGRLLNNDDVCLELSEIPRLIEFFQEAQKEIDGKISSNA